MLLVLLLLHCTALVAAQCGSLVTYRQHADLLKTAPKCLREGCRQGEENSTISSSCPSTSSCSLYWNMFVEQFDQKHSWCSTLTCDSDPACRISGWPVLNATTLCQSTPNQLLFGGGEDGCCTQNNEPFELAEWTGSLCNGSEWRQQFEICGGMACLDWREWIMPWNWTVMNDTLPPDQQNCTAPSKYLAVYAGEHFFWLLATFGIGWIRLRIARHEEAKDRSVGRYWLISVWSVWTGLRYEQKKEEVFKEKTLPEGEQYRPPLTDKLRWGFPVIMGAFMAGLQLGFNFWAAHIIKSAPGYEDVPLGLLALLFCCRPRLSWLSCLLALISKERLEKRFKFKPNGDGVWAAKLVLSSVAVTSAVTEAILQLFGAYFLGQTAHIGAERGFYRIHRLRPKMWGEDARHMYLGALFWAMLCIPLVAVWFFIALFYSAVYHAVSRWRKSIFDFLRPKTENVPKIIQRPLEKIIDYIEPKPVVSPRTLGPYGNANPFIQPMMVNDDQPHRAQDYPYDQPMPYGGPATGEMFNDQPLPVRNTSRRSRYSALPQLEFTDQPMMVHQATSSGNYRAVSGGYTHENTGIQRRTPSGGQYGALAQNEDLEMDLDDQPLPASVVSTGSPLNRDPVSYYQKQNTLDGSNTSLLPPSSGGNSSSNKRSDYTDGVTLKWQHWESKIIWAGAFLGMLAYASQWAFWDGLVKTAGDRFCPPSLLKVSGLWWGGAILYVGAPFLGY